VTWALWFCLTFAYYGFFTWIPSLLVAQGMTLTKSFGYSLLIYVMQIPGYFSAAFLSEKLDRKRTIALYLTGGALAAQGLANAGNDGAILVFASLLSFFMNAAYAGLYSYTPEVPNSHPLHRHGRGLGLRAGGRHRSPDHHRIRVREHRLRRRVRAHHGCSLRRCPLRPGLRPGHRRPNPGGDQRGRRSPPHGGRDRGQSRSHRGLVMTGRRTEQAQYVLLDNATVLDDEAGGYTEGQRVLVCDDHILEVGGKGVSAPEGARVIDVRGRTLLPGLTDGHVHVTAVTADLAAQAEWSQTYVAARSVGVMRDMLRRGFTTVRDMGGAEYGVAAAVHEGFLEGPRVLYCGKAISQTGGHADLRPRGRVVLMEQHRCSPNIGVVCDGADEVRRGAREQLRTGADHIKIMLSGGVA
jgi:hypothetical protein